MIYVGQVKDPDGDRDSGYVASEDFETEFANKLLTEVEWMTRYVQWTGNHMDKSPAILYGYLPLSTSSAYVR
jgi:hypothetical protein